MAPRANQAAWEKTADDLAADPARLSELGVVSIEKLSERTGMSTATIHDTLFRKPVTDPDNAKTHLCRPAFRIASTPYWSEDQASDAERVAATSRGRTGAGPTLPMTNDGRDKALSVRDLHKITGFHEQTARRWVSGSYAPAGVRGFPAAIGRRKPSRRHGNPETVYPRPAVLDWLRQAGILDPAVTDAEVDARLDAAVTPEPEPAGV